MNPTGVTYRSTMRDGAYWLGRLPTGKVIVALLVLAGILGVAPSASAGPNRSAALATGAGHLRFGLVVDGGPLAVSTLTQAAQSAGERPSVEMWYADFAQPVPVAQLDAVVSRGASPIITWEPWLWGGGLNQRAYALDRITAGDHDSYIRSWAVGLRNWGRPVTLRFAHEMNGSWYPWAEGVNGNGAGDYVAAWRHVHSIVTAAGATNVSWMWSPNTPPTGPVALSRLYPGAAYVNSVALDGYNWGTTRSWSSWTSPSALFGKGLTELRSLAPGKPIMIGETASAEGGGSKATWIRDLLKYLSAQPDVSGFIWFQMNKESDWRFNSSAASRIAFAAALATRR